MRSKISLQLALGGMILLVLVSSSGAASGSIQWHSFDEGMALGNSTGKMIFVNFYADWCRYCHVMDKETFKNKDVVAFINENFVAIKVDHDRDKKIAKMFKVKGLPDNWFFSEDGEVIGHRPGYIPPELFMQILKSLQSAEN